MHWIDLTRLSIGCVLGIAALAKAWRPMALAASVRGYGVRSAAAQVSFGVALVVTETTVAGLLLGAVVPRAALAAASVLFLAFAILGARSARRSGSYSCGCLGEALDITMGWTGVGLNAGVAAIAAIGALQPEAADASEPSLLVLTALLLGVLYWLVLYATSVLARAAQPRQGSVS